MLSPKLSRSYLSFALSPTAFVLFISLTSVAKAQSALDTAFNPNAN